MSMTYPDEPDRDPRPLGGDSGHDERSAMSQPATHLTPESDYSAVAHVVVSREVQWASSRLVCRCGFATGPYPTEREAFKTLRQHVIDVTTTQTAKRLPAPVEQLRWDI